MTQEQKRTIEETIPDEFAYDLGMVEKEEKRIRLYSKVFFSDSNKDPDYTEKDVEQLYSEIEKDVNETIGEEEEE